MLNYRHLYDFWVVSKEGGFARAAERLDMAVHRREIQRGLVGMAGGLVDRDQPNPRQLSPSGRSAARNCRIQGQ